MRIRAAAADDAAVFASIHRQCFDQEWSELDFRALLTDHFVFGFLATSNPVGEFESLLLARAAGGEAEILTLATLPAVRRQGLALELLSAASLEALGRGALAIFLELQESNRAAAELYLRSGFRVVGRRPAYYVSRDQIPADALILRKDLSRP